MKHTPPVTLILISLFVISQLVGLALVAHTTPTDYTAPSNQEAAQRGGSLLLGVLIGTLVLLLIIKFKLLNIWKLWYLIAVFAAISVTLQTLINPWIALTLAAILAALKVYKPTIILHNITEILVYSGIALLVTIGFNLNILIAAGVLLIVALYDMYAVWRSKHMVKMAEFQTQSKLFAGLLIPYEKNKVKLAAPVPKKAPKKTTSGAKTAVLGGGDIAFPLIFSAAALQWLVSRGYTPGQALIYTLPIVAVATIALSGLFLLAKQDRYYPAMPFLTAGCYVGFALTWLFSTISSGV